MKVILAAVALSLFSSLANANGAYLIIEKRKQDAINEARASEISLDTYMKMSRYCTDRKAKSVPIVTTISASEKVVTGMKCEYEGHLFKVPRI
jgi:hypothetical protein